MNLQLIPLKRPRKPEDSKQVFLICLAFLLGVSTYLIFGERFSGYFDKSLTVLNLDYRIFGCVFLLIIIQLSSFSVIGSLFVFVFDYIFALFCALSLDSIIPQRDLGVLFISKLLLIVFIVVFLLFSFSRGAMRSSLRFFRRLGNERTLKTEAAKLAVLIILAVIISVIGLTDINTYM